MMFKPTERPYPADDLDLKVLNQAKRHPIADEDIRRLFAGRNAIWVRVYKVARDALGKMKLISRSYSLPIQRDEFIGDMFDIAHYHRIVGLSEPCALYVEETTEGTSIGAETIEAIVGKLDD